MTEKTLYNTDMSGTKVNVPDVVMHGDDLFKLLSKASSESEMWMKSTKAMEIEGVGCVVQVTTQQGTKTPQAKTSRAEPVVVWEIAEAVTFVPNTTIVMDDGIYKLVKVGETIKLNT